MSQHIHNAVLEEFGDPSFDLSFTEDQAQEVEIWDMDSQHKGAVVDLVDFPWASGLSGQQAQPVASGVQRIHTSDILTHSPYQDQVVE